MMYQLVVISGSHQPPMAVMVGALCSLQAEQLEQKVWIGAHLYVGLLLDLIICKK